MFKKPKRDETLILGADEGKTKFHRADVLYALEWSAVAPGMGGWDVLLDDEERTRLVSVVPPGSDTPTFFIYNKGREVVLTWQAPSGKSDVMEIGRFASLRTALLALCPLNEEQTQAVNESMEFLYPRALRNNR